jgi:hypothetical protein
MEMTWHANKIFWRIIFNYNLPFFLWVGAAVLQVGGMALFERCLIAGIFGHCFGCGLTHDLAALITLQRAEGLWVYYILSGFLINLFYSVALACSKASNGALMSQDISQ